jgi:hypothetical protein
VGRSLGPSDRPQAARDEDPGFSGTGFGGGIVRRPLLVLSVVAWTVVMTSTVIGRVGRRPGPRLLIRGFGKDVGERLADLFPTREFVDNFDEVAIHEWDALLTSQPTEVGQRSLYTLILPRGQPPTTALSVARIPPYAEPFGVGFGRQTYAREMYVEESVSGAVRDLVVRELLPVLTARPVQYGLVLRANLATGGRFPIRPIALTSDHLTLAGWIDDDGGAPCWILPAEVPDPVPWMRAIYAEWSAAEPDRFPPGADWRRQAAWQTDAELKAARALSESRVAMDEAVQHHLDRIALAQQAFEEVAAEAERGHRRLLTARGDELKDTVAAALKHLGFGVEDRDLVAKKGDKLEDLRVTDPDAPGWIALAEVRSHTHGAQLRDLFKIDRAVNRFVREERRLPDRKWYVVNAFVDLDPSEREQPLRSNPTEVEQWAADGGAVIDTRLLFDLVRDVEMGAISTEAARAQLRELSSAAHSTDGER